MTNQAPYTSITLETLQSMVVEDLHMNRANIVDESIKTSSLFSKYLNILSKERTILRGLTKQKEELEFSKYKFYTGKSDEPEVSPMRVLKAEADKYIGGDKDVMSLKGRILVQQEKVDLLTEVVKHINSRSFTISNIIKALQFENGIGG